MRRTLSGVLAVVAMIGHAQMLQVRPELDDPMALRFDAIFIQRNGVERISGQNSVKREGEPMRDKKDRSMYRFDATGRTVYASTSFGRPGSGRDTASVTWWYDPDHRAMEELRNDLNGYFALRDSLDSLGRPVRRTYMRIDNMGTDRYDLVRGAETLISDERFTYSTLGDTVERKTWYNELGLPYREQFRHKDEWGYLRLAEDHYLITGRRGRITFRYAEKGRLAERTEQTDLSVPAISMHTWRYDVAGNVTVCDLSRNGKPVRHVEYLYEEGTMFLKAVLAHDHETGLIHITRYTTERR